MDLSKAFDTINHELLIGKLNAYGFEKSALKLLLNYLSNRWQRTNINKKFSSWIELMQSVPQGSALRSLLFNIYLNDLFLFGESTAVWNFVDGTTFFACEKDLNSLINRLEHDSLLLIEWFEHNHTKLNQEKCHLLSVNRFENIWANIGNAKIWESPNQKLLGVVIDRDLSFDRYVSSLCRKAGKKLSAGLSLYMSINQRRILAKYFIEAQFTYDQVIWMFHTRELNKKINHIHEHALRIDYRDNSSSFIELPKKGNSVYLYSLQKHPVLSYQIVQSKTHYFKLSDIRYLSS